MKRTKPPLGALADNATVDAILTSDWHLRETTPICRTDNFWEEQWRKVTYIAHLQHIYQCPVLHAGDLFHHWKPSPYLLTKTVQYLPRQFFTVYGQHDLPQHSLDLCHKSGVFTLFTTGALSILGGTHFGQEVTEESMSCASRHILVWHKLVWSKNPPWPNCSEPRAEEVLDRYHQFDLILTGDNHKPFVVEGEAENLLVNPGSLTRQTADQESHHPRVYLWSAKTNQVRGVYVPISQGVISREHIDSFAERDERIEAFVSRLRDDWRVGLSFEDNLQQFFNENNIEKRVKDIIWKAIETS